MGKTFGLPASARLRRKQDIERVFREGRFLRAYPLAARALPREDGESRLGLAIKIRPPRSVVRNRWKRAVREAFRLNRHKLQKPYDLMVMKSGGAGESDLARVPDAVLRIIQQMNAGPESGAKR